MFWNFMHKVHNLPTFKRKDTDPWWTDEERERLKLVKRQLPYMRIGDEESKLPVLEKAEGERFDPCFGEIDLFLENGVEVIALPERWVEFFEEHLGFGKYVGSVDFSDAGKIPWVNEAGHVKPDVSRFTDRVMVSFVNDRGPMWGGSSGITRHCDVADEDYEVDICDVMIGDEKVGIAYSYDEGPECEFVHVFEKGSIAYAHYGRGAGLSVRFHSSLEMEEEPLDHFQQLAAQR